MPSSPERITVAKSGQEADAAATMTDKQADMATIRPAWCVVSSPVHSGRYGLFIRSMSTSAIWFRPTIATFISSAETSAPPTVLVRTGQAKK